MPALPIIRRARESDLPTLGRLGAMLVQTHIDFDAQRFMNPGGDIGEGYAWFLRAQIRDSDVAIFVADMDGEVVGYVYTGIEPQSWKELRDEAGFIHDVIVDEQGRGGGVATALLDAAIEWLRSRGVPRVILWTAEPNRGAQRLFARLGFRRTMVEMTREL